MPHPKRTIAWFLIVVFTCLLAVAGILKDTSAKIREESPASAATAPTATAHAIEVLLHVLCDFTPLSVLLLATIQFFDATHKFEETPAGQTFHRQWSRLRRYFKGFGKPRHTP